MKYFVARDTGGAICFAAQYAQEGYAEEQLDDASSAELQTFLAPPVPQVVDRSQAILQLAADSKLDAAVAAVGAADTLAQQLWLMPKWERTNATLVQLSTGLGYDTDAKRDGFFIAASKIVP
jgi:hypothetical protein